MLFTVATALDPSGGSGGGTTPPMIASTHGPDKQFSTYWVIDDTEKHCEYSPNQRESSAVMY